MRSFVLATFCATLLFGLSNLAQGQQVRTYQEDGITYRETRRIVRTPVTETQMVERQQTVYREEVTRETQEVPVNTFTPVTEYRWTPRWHGVLNPFVEPYVTYELLPFSYWQTQSETQQREIVRRELVPEVQTVQTPQTTTRYVEREEITRVALTPVPRRTAAVNLSPTPASSTPWVARQTTIGGVSQLESDPPRGGTASGTTVR